MVKAIGVLLNIVIVAYLGYQSASCLGPDVIEGVNPGEHPLILSFVAVVSLFIASKES